MKQSELRQIIKESNIRDDAKALLDQLIGLKLLKSGYVTTTGNSARGKNKIIGTPNVEYNTFTSFNDAIKQNFKKVGSTSMSSAVFSNGTVHFFYYPSNSNRFDIVVRRKNYKGIKEMKKSELRQIIKEEVNKMMNEEKSDLSNILFDIATLLDSLDNEQLKNIANLNSNDYKLLRKSSDGMMSNLKPIKYLIDTTQLSK